MDIGTLSSSVTKFVQYPISIYISIDYSRSIFYRKRVQKTETAQNSKPFTTTKKKPVDESEEI